MYVYRLCDYNNLATFFKQSCLRAMLLANLYSRIKASRLSKSILGLYNPKDIASLQHMSGCHVNVTLH